ncbi:MAG: hypothetical protein M1546_02300 [Chloroflexi bacterium]|nr:hypothetical protein [Chloroflexota bacterium]
MRGSIQLYRVSATAVTAVFTAITVMMLIGCASVTQPIQGTPDTTFLTPIPQATLDAYRSGAPIEGKLHAVIAARVNLGHKRLSSAGEPTVISVEALSLSDAQKRVRRPGEIAYEDRPPYTQVWFVLFEGEWQVNPPDPQHTYTPQPPRHGCVFVIIEASGGVRSEVGGIDCPQS